MEFCHCYDIERIVCFTVGNGWLPICGLYRGIPGAYGCHTLVHAMRMRVHLAQVVFMLKQDPDSKLYDPKLIQLLEQASEYMAKTDARTPTKRGGKREQEDPASGEKARKLTRRVSQWRLHEYPGDSEDEEPPRKKARNTSPDSSQWTSEVDCEFVPLHSHFASFFF